MKNIWIAMFAMAVIVAVIAILFVLNDHRQNPVVESKNNMQLSMQEKEKAIAIGMNDSFVRREIDQTGIYAGVDHINFVIKDVVISSFLDTSPGVNMSRTLPAIVIVTGNENETGANLFVFVDLDKGRVAYIGYVPRPGINNSKIAYASYGSGVEVRYLDRDAISYLYNLTIVDTGYSRDLNDSQRSEIVDMALNDTKVKSYLDGHTYYLDDVSFVSLESGVYHGYKVDYPIVRFWVSKPGKYEPEYYVTASVNTINKKVYAERSDQPFMRPLEYPV